MMFRVDPALFDDAPFFYVKKAGARLTTRGVASCSLGHRLPGTTPKPDGVFAHWQWDGCRLIVENDHFGMFPVFYFANAKEFCISSSLFKLLAEGAATDIDWAALAVFLRIGFFVGEDTAFQAIRALPPNARLEWADGRLSVSGGYPFVRPQQLSQRAVKSGYIDLFRAAVSKRTPDHDDFAVLLSGGRDSRHILLELCDQKRPPRFCLTGRRYPSTPGEDERIAASVAAAVGVKHVVVDPPHDEIRGLITTNILTHMTAPERGWKRPLALHLQQTVTASYDGIGGDVLSGGTALDSKSVKLMRAGRIADYCRHLFRDSDRALRRIVPPVQYGRILADLAVARLELELRRHEDAPNPITSFQFWNRTRRFNSSSPYSLFAGVPVVYSPFLDRELQTFLSSLPVETAADGALHDDVIRTAYPRYGALPYEADDVVDIPTVKHRFDIVRGLIAHMVKNWPARLVDPTFLMPRLVAALPTYLSQPAVPWFVPVALYLMLLEAVAFKGLLSIDGK